MFEIFRICVLGIDDERKIGIKICKFISFRILNRYFFSISDLVDVVCIVSVIKYYCFIEVCIIVVYNIFRIILLEVSKVKGNRINKVRENE